MLSIVLRFVLVDRLRIENKIVKMVFSDEGRDYTPIGIEKELTKKLQVYKEQKDFLRFVGLKTELVKMHINDDFTNRSLPNRIHFIELASLYEKSLNWYFFPNADIYDLGDGMFTELVKKADVHYHATSLCELKDYLDKLNIHLLYVQCPHKNSKNDFFIGSTDFSNENADNLLHELSLKKVPYLDIREYIQKENLVHHNLFYKTDHHWKAETGLWSTKILSGYLNENAGFEIDLNLFDPKRYRYDVYENRFLGTYGRKVTLKRANPEDISLIDPMFESDCSLRIPGKNIDTQGNFSVFYDYKQIEKENYYNLNPFEAYLHGNNSTVFIHNNLSPNKKKVLFLKDSYALAVIPFFSLAVENVEVLDLRIFTGSVKTYIEQTMPDIVIVMYNPSIIFDVYEEGKDVFDFK
jgi:hypothetical protein